MTDQLTVLDFNQIHTHSCASKRDALSKVSDLVSEAKRLGQRAIAVTDHGVLHAVPELFRECRKQGIKAVAGMEGYLCEDVNDPDCKTNYHQLLIAINETGWKNLMRLSSEAYTHFHNRPRFDWAMMEKYSEGIIATSSCLSGVIPKAILEKGYMGVGAYYSRYLDIFGDRFYLEIQPTPIPEQQIVNKALVKLHMNTGAPLVATGDVHYAKQEDYLAHQGVLALGWAKKLKHPDEPAYPCEEHYWMKPGELILEEFVSQGFDRETIITAINNTGVIVDRVDFDLKKEKDLLPEYPLPEGVTDKNKYIGELVKEGMMRKYRPVTKEVVDRIKFELDVIREKGYVDYFLVVADAIKWCKEQGIIVNPRGSVGGSVVAYCLDITEIDSIKYHLYFERFLDITRFKMPDVDLDCESARRGELLDYLRGKYDSDKVCQVTNYGRMTAKLAFKNACQVYDIPFKESKMITELVDDAPKMTIEKARKLNPALVEFMDKSTEKFKQKDNDAYVTAREISWMAQKFEGVMDKLGKHAGGVLVASEPIADYFPTYLPDHLDKDTVVCQWDKDDLEELGGVKFDFLGLKTLGTVGLAVKSIKEEYGIDIDYREIMRTPDDPKVFELIATGKTQNMFQFGSNMMQNLCQRVKPNNIMDIVAINSLGRPAALGSGDTQRWIDIRNGLSEEVYSHPDEVQVTGETKGVIAYQEHVMRLVNVFAGWTLGKGDSLRKKSVEELEAMRDQFVFDACDHNETTIASEFADQMDELWSRIIAYSGYGFNKAHAVEYSLMTYMSAWLELYYPAHWLAAVMTVKMDKKEKVAQGLADIKANGFDFNPPDINLSGTTFTAHNNKITFPLSVINGVGDKAVQSIMEERSKQPFTSLEDILSRIPKRQLNAKVMKGLIFAGAFDSLYPELDRQAIYEDYMVIKGESKKKLEEVASQEWNDTIKANWEKDLLGVYISAHPLQRYHFRNWQEFADQSKALVGGLVSKVKTINDRNGKRMAFVTLDTYQGAREVIVFAKTFAKYGDLLEVGQALMIDGYKDNASLKANTIKPLEVN